MTTTVVDRYRLHGLLRNPFAVWDGASNTLNPSHDALFVSRDLPSPPDAGAATLVQLIGEKGAGKTTQLQRWRLTAPGPYHHVPHQPYRDRWCRPPVADLVYADEIDRLPAPVRWRWFTRLGHHGSTIVAGTHVDLTAAARRTGLTVRTHVLGPVDYDCLRNIVERRFAAAALPGAANVPALTAADLRAIHERSNGSIRRAEYHLHQLVARIVG